jgi:hypothetical protein
MLALALAEAATMKDAPESAVNLMTARLRTLSRLDTKKERKVISALRTALCEARREITELKAGLAAVATPTDNTAELESAKARIRELSNQNDALLRSASRPVDDEKGKAYGYLRDCVAALASLDQSTRLKIFKHVIDTNGVPSWNAVEFEKLLGYPRHRVSSPEPEVESVNVAPPSSPVPPVEPPQKFLSIAELEARLAATQKEIDKLEGGTV